VKRPCFAFLACLVLSSLFRPSLRSQEEKPFRIHVDVALVNVDAAVVDARGRFVAGLTERNFHVLEDGRQQQVTHFASL